MKPKLIGICGPSNSGKSTLCKELSKKYKAEWIEIDHYYKDIEEIPLLGKPFPKKWRNWELPNDFNLKKLYEDLKALKQGKSIKVPIYSFTKGYIKGWKKVKPGKVVLIEGFYLFKDKKIRDILDVKIYLDIPIKEILKRRVFPKYLQKYEWAKKDYTKEVYLPMYKKYGVSQKKYVDLVIRGTKPLKDIIEKVDEIINYSIN